MVAVIVIVLVRLRRLLDHGRLGGIGLQPCPTSTTRDNIDGKLTVTDG
jgi:hypothetical protein